MRILLVNQTFHPDVVSTAQYLTDLAQGLTAAGHQVTVLTGATGYDNPSVRFPTRELWKGISIVRLRSLRMGKGRRWRRAVDFGSFMASAAASLTLMPRFDAVVALTSPPLISTLAHWFVRLKGGRLICWVMDLNPDESVAAGWLSEGSLVTRTLDQLLRSSLRGASSVVVLDRFMRDRVVSKGVDAATVAVVPPWSHDEDVRYDAIGRDRIRRELGIEGRFVVMYAGNHSPCNPLQTLIAAAERLSARPDVHFCFVGGGSQFAPLREEAERRAMRNVTFVPYRSRHELGGVLSAADLHVVSLGDPFVGILHPCKIYNIVRVRRPVLYFGPAESHLSDIGATTDVQMRRVAHGDVDAAAGAILAARDSVAEVAHGTEALDRFSVVTVLPRLINIVEGRPAGGAAVATQPA